MWKRVVMKNCSAQRNQTPIISVWLVNDLLWFLQKPWILLYCRIALYTDMRMCRGLRAYHVAVQGMQIVKGYRILEQACSHSPNDTGYWRYAVTCHGEKAWLMTVSVSSLAVQNILASMWNSLCFSISRERLSKLSWN